MVKLSASTSSEISAREKAHLALARQLAPQGMVLLENDGTLPLSAQPVALYGTGARHTVRGGTGSGDVNVREAVSVERGLLDAGFRVTTGAWLDAYDSRMNAARAEYAAMLREKSAAGENPILLFFGNPFVEPDSPDIEEAGAAEPGAALAIYVLARNSGEGKDRLAAPGDYYLREKEKADLLYLRARYAKLIVVLNIGGVIDTGFFRALSPNALLLMSQPGSAGGNALADALTGATPPSGRLTDTWALAYADYPSSAAFGRNDGNVDAAEYTEGIYVGYRYFDTFGKPVAYPFGYGLDYTEFTMEAVHAAANENGVSLRVRVTNTGARPGRQVAQVYVSPPEGGLEKPYQQLAAFGKTKPLAPGEAEELQLSFSLRAMASYCEGSASWVLEPGRYFLRLGRHSRDSRVVAAVDVARRTVLEALENRLRPQKPLRLLSGQDATPITYPGEAAEKAAAPVLTVDCDAVVCERAVYRGADSPLPAVETERPITAGDVLSGKYSLEALVAQLSADELAALCVGAGGSQSVIGLASQRVQGAAGESSALLEETRDLRALIMADGPAGLRLTPRFKATAEGEVVSGGGMFAALPGLEPPEAPEAAPEDAVEYFQYCTAIPIATCIAQSWDLELAKQLGALVGREMREFKVSLWLAPGMNIHRNPLCGRNFEYFSEDPLLTGLMAAMETSGIQSVSGVGATPKHFACNNQEDNRNYVDSVVSERALREIYLRGFELCVKLARPMSIMTSYNLINGTHAANSRDLLTDILRDEWGFTGFVMTDWGTTGHGAEMPGQGRDSVPALCVLAGNDLIMPGGARDVADIAASCRGETGHPVPLASLQACALRLLRAALGSHLYTDAEPRRDQSV